MERRKAKNGKRETGNDPPTPHFSTAEFAENAENKIQRLLRPLRFEMGVGGRSISDYLFPM